jgi:hypothetical protein
MQSRSRFPVCVAALVSLPDPPHQDPSRVRSQESPLDVLLHDAVDGLLVFGSNADESPRPHDLARFPSPAGDVPEGLRRLVFAGKSEPHQLGRQLDD